MGGGGYGGNVGGGYGGSVGGGAYPPPLLACPPCVCSFPQAPPYQAPVGAQPYQYQTPVGAQPYQPVGAPSQPYQTPVGAPTQPYLPVVGAQPPYSSPPVAAPNAWFPPTQPSGPITGGGVRTSPYMGPMIGMEGPRNLREPESKERSNE